MGSSIQACYDMLEEEEYKRKLARAENVLLNMSPSQFLTIIDSIDSNLQSIRKGNMVMGTESFWSSLKRIEENLNHLK